MPILNEEGQLVSHELGYCIDCRTMYVIGARDYGKCPKHQDQFLPVDDVEDWLKHYLAASNLCTNCGALMFKKSATHSPCWYCNHAHQVKVKELFESWPPAEA